MVDNDILLTEKDTSMDPSASSELDELGGTNSGVPSSSEHATLASDHELQHLRLESKPKSSKPKIKKPASLSQYKPEPWMLQSEDQKMRKQLNLAVVSNNCIFDFQLFAYSYFICSALSLSEILC